MALLRKMVDAWRNGKEVTIGAVEVPSITNTEESRSENSSTFVHVTDFDTENPPVTIVNSVVDGDVFSTQDNTSLQIEVLCTKNADESTSENSGSLNNVTNYCDIENAPVIILESDAINNQDNGSLQIEGENVHSDKVEEIIFVNPGVSNLSEETTSVPVVEVNERISDAIASIIMPSVIKKRGRPAGADTTIIGLKRKRNKKQKKMP